MPSTTSRGSFLLLFLLAAPTSLAHAADLPDAPTGEKWLAALQDRIATDVRAGRPVVAQVHVALCDNSVIHCGGHGLGDGASLEKNLYWATSGGLHGFLSRRGSPWKLVARHTSRRAEILVTEIWHRRVLPGEAFAHREIKQPFDLCLIAEAWRGTDKGQHKPPGRVQRALTNPTFWRRFSQRCGRCAE